MEPFDFSYPIQPHLQKTRKELEKEFESVYGAIATESFRTIRLNHEEHCKYLFEDMFNYTLAKHENKWGGILTKYKTWIKNEAKSEAENFLLLCKRDMAAQEKEFKSILADLQDQHRANIEALQNEHESNLKQLQKEQFATYKQDVEQLKSDMRSKQTTTAYNSSHRPPTTIHIISIEEYNYAFINRIQHCGGYCGTL